MIRALKSNTLRQSMRAGARKSMATATASRTFTTGRIASVQLAAATRYASWTMPKSNPSRLMMVRGYADVVKVPEMAESITEGTLREFTKEVGDYVEVDEEIASIETDKIDVAVNAPFSGTITEFLAQPEDTVEVGQPLLKIEKGDPPAGGAKKAAPKETAPKEAAPQEAAPKEAAPKEAAPKEEAPKVVPEAPKQEEAPKKEAAPKKDAPKESAPRPTAGSFSRDENVVKMNRMRLRIAERLKESQNTAAALTTFNEVDMSAVMQMRKLYKDDIIKKTGVKIGFMGLFAKASTLAMRDIPTVNASIEGTNMIYRDYVDISVAVATPKGLVTPVIRNAESLDVVGLEREIASLGARARDGKLGLEDMAGGTFTISNGGVFGSLMGTPIINMPQCAVLGLHGVKDRPVAVDGKVEIRPMMYLALTYDHRILDGREAVTFLRLVKEYIEDPRKMLLA